MRMKSPSAGTVSTPSRTRRVSVSSPSSPPASTTCALSSTWMFALPSISSMRYLRHALLDGASAEERDAPGVARQVHRRLTGRVRAADDVDALPRELPRLGRRRPVVDTPPLQVRERRNVEPPIRDSRREDDASRLDARAAGYRDGVRGLAELDVLHLAREQERRTEDPCLLVRALRELGAAQPPRESEVVADPRARSRLPADRLALDDQRVQALRRRVDGGREPRRPGSDDHHVERPGCLELRGHSGPVLREVLGGRIDER